MTLALAVGFAIVGITGTASADGDTYPEPVPDARVGRGRQRSGHFYDDCEVTTVSPPTVPVIDDCGPGNAHYGAGPHGAVDSYGPTPTEASR